MAPFSHAAFGFDRGDAASLVRPPIGSILDFGVSRADKLSNHWRAELPRGESLLKRGSYGVRAAHQLFGPCYIELKFVGIEGVNLFVELFEAVLHGFSMCRLINRR